MKYDVIVIGGGLGGLECGYILSRAGKSVLVLEQGRQIGGCLQSYRRNGLEFDTGFHYVGGLGEGQPLYHVFSYLGLASLPWLRMDEEFDRVTIAGCEYALAQGYDNFAVRLAEDFPKEKEALKRYASLLYETECRQLDGLNPDCRNKDSALFECETNAYQYLCQLFRNEGLIDAVSGASLKMELRKVSLPLFTFLHGNSGYIGSSWRLKGSGSMLPETLAEGIRKQGGEIKCHAEAKELIGTGKGIARVRCAEGDEYEGDVFIGAVHPASVCRMVKQAGCLKPAYRNRIFRQANTFGAFTVSLVLNPGKIRYFNYNRYVYRNADVWSPVSSGGIDRIMISCKVPESGGYARQIDLLAPFLWEECMPWAQTEVGKRGEEYLLWKERIADACLDLAETVMPGLRNTVMRRYISTPLTYAGYLHAPEGSAYGIRKDAGSPLEVLLSPRTPIPNLYLTGQSLMMHGVQGVTQTALFTCAEILGREWIWKHIIEEKDT